MDPNTNEPQQWERDFERSNNDKEPCFPDGDYYLTTDFDVPELRRKIEETTADLCFSFRESDNPGNFLCNFLYYRSLYYAKKRDVLLIHVPDTLVQGVTVDSMVSVLDHVIHDLLDMQSQRYLYSVPDRHPKSHTHEYVEVIISHHEKIQTDIRAEYSEIRDDVKYRSEEVIAPVEIYPDQDDTQASYYYAEITNDMKLLTVSGNGEEQQKLQKVKRIVQTKKQIRESRRRRKRKRNSRQRKHK